MIANTLRAYEHNLDIRDELYQDVALALWRALPGFRGDANIKTFIARITHNIGVSHIRKAVKQPPCVELDANIVSGDLTPEANASINNKREIMMSCIARLPLKHRQVITLYLEEFSQKEISGILGTTEGNVAVRLTRARASLKTMMEIYR